jgi:hypothetical protein
MRLTLQPHEHAGSHESSRNRLLKGTQARRALRHRQCASSQKGCATIEKACQRHGIRFPNSTLAAGTKVRMALTKR